MSKYTEDDLRVDLENKKYEFGWETKIDYEDFPIGLNEDIIRAISAKKDSFHWLVPPKNASGCSQSGTVTVGEPQPLVEGTIPEDGLLICYDGYGTLSGSATGGTAPYYFVWNTGDTTQDLNNVPIGTYSVDVTINKSSRQRIEVQFGEQARPVQAQVRQIG